MSGQLLILASLPAGTNASMRCLVGYIDSVPSIGLEDMERRKILSVPAIELLPFDRRASNQWPYRLLNPGSYALLQDVRV
jgi:hypothetical protein